jgi:RAT1-interacting protein
MSKRTFSEFQSEGHSSDICDQSLESPSASRRSPPPKRTKTDPTLDYPDTSRPASRSIQFQQPTQIISFSYTPTHTLEFTNSALRYLVDPPLSAKLGYGYDRWVKKPEERSRIDALLQAFSKARSGSASASLRDVEVVAWRGVMTRCAIMYLSLFSLQF